jgi:PKD repeat protein
MTSMSRKARLAVIFGAIAIAVGIGVTLVMTNNQTLAGIFQLGASQEDENENENDMITFGQSFAFMTKYKTTLLVGEEGLFNGSARNGKEPYQFEWKFSDGAALTGQKITRSFNSPGTYYFDLTVTDADGKQVKGEDLSFNVTQETSREEEVTPNITSRLMPHS